VPPADTNTQPFGLLGIRTIAAASKVGMTRNATPPAPAVLIIHVKSWQIAAQFHVWIAGPEFTASFNRTMTYMPMLHDLCTVLVAAWSRPRTKAALQHVLARMTKEF
jgi:hypothetical protein